MLQYCTVCGIWLVTEKSFNSVFVPETVLNLFGQKHHVFTDESNFYGLKEIVNQLQGKPVYFTLDLDVLDRSVFPGTGTPEAGGVSFQELLEAMIQVSHLNIVGFDVNELSPVYDQSGSSTAMACKVLRELLTAVMKNRAEQPS